GAGGWVLFFKAEAGIRDWSVTGVQTCALPISRSGGTAGKIAEFWIVPAGATYQGGEPVVDETKIKPIPDHPARKAPARRSAGARSEERRVGKESRRGC